MKTIKLFLTSLILCVPKVLKFSLIVFCGISCALTLRVTLAADNVAPKASQESVKTSTKNQKNAAKKNIKSSTKNVIAKANIVRKVVQAKKKKAGIKAQTEEQMPKADAFSISRKTIAVKSPMCEYAAKNDVIALKRALMANNYAESDVNTICKNGESLLMLATKNDNYITVNFLLEKGADVNISNAAGVTPLHLVARTDTKQSERIFDLLMHNKKLDVDVKDMEGYTPLMRAVEFENLIVIKRLIRMRANLDIKNNYGKDARELATQLLESKKTDEEKAIAQSIVDILK